MRGNERKILALGTEDRGSARHDSVFYKEDLGLRGELRGEKGIEKGKNGI